MIFSRGMMSTCAAVSCVGWEVALPTRCPVSVSHIWCIFGLTNPLRTAVLLTSLCLLPAILPLSHILSFGGPCRTPFKGVHVLPLDELPHPCIEPESLDWEQTVVAAMKDKKTPKRSKRKSLASKSDHETVAATPKKVHVENGGVSSSNKEASTHVKMDLERAQLLVQTPNNTSYVLTWLLTTLSKKYAFRYFFIFCIFHTFSILFLFYRYFHTTPLPSTLSHSLFSLLLALLL